MTTTTLENIILPSHGPDATFDITITSNTVTSVTPSSSSPTSPKSPSLLLPTLCHPHLHLDKAYLLTSNNPTYAHLSPKTGSFSEALTTTSQAKSLYTEADLYLRGAQLLSTIYTQGATTARTFVEVDATGGLLPLTVARRLKHDFGHLIDLQLVAFAQDPLFSTPSGEANRSILAQVLDSAAVVDISVLGTTPYVESDLPSSLRNITWARETAVAKKLHLDFHLDYNLAPPPAPAPPPPPGPPLPNEQGHVPPQVQDEPLAYHVALSLASHRWKETNPGKTVVLGHCTRLSEATPLYLQRTADVINGHGLPVHFVGLPTSDIFMMGRDRPHSRPRGTLPVLDLIREYNLSCCLGVNNVGNAFTPYGTGDPLSLASWGVGLYQAGAEGDAEVLYGCVSWRARRAIGLGEERDDREGGEMDVVEGMRWRGGLVVENREAVEVPGREGEVVMRVPARQRRSVRDVVWDPPEVGLRRVVR